MGKVIVGLSMSLDGFIAGPDDGPELPLGRGGERLFAWMNAGPEANRVDRLLAPPDASRPVVDAWRTETGAIVSGRRTFDIANGWKDGHPIDVPVFVVTHEGRAAVRRPGPRSHRPGADQRHPVGGRDAPALPGAPRLTRPAPRPRR